MAAKYISDVIQQVADTSVGVVKIEQRFSYQALVSLVTLTVKSGAGFLHAITVGGYSCPTIVIYDATAASGTLIGTLVASVPPGTYTFNTSFGTGLTLRPLPGTAVLPSLTISYR